MNIEQIQKINDLALDLMKQGLAQDREEAIAQAEKIFHQGSSEEFKEMRETMQEVKEKRESAPVQKEAEQEMSQDQIKNILEQNSAFLVKTIKKFQEKIITLEAEMKQIRATVNYSKLPTVKDVVSQRTEVPKEKPKEIQQTESSQPKGDSHPRSGNYSDADVSIEKYFYMGNK
jgi:hypothetical protein